ncbi:uncharacterized protein LOC115775342 isoform X2 [Archocentrus centrarchus]|uniref:uncharacterized protein LOC115775342 isoform X2 n=1 Tax=Archocentrus centrarchus TaxID=63155 RepID=UPI0011EA3BF2|nr:uncharacterized protein LOC115775342 isoform X2 [Archocentrus centrarchus]
MYLIKSLQKEEAAGIAMAERHSKDSLQSFVQYALGFPEIKSLQDYEASRVSAAAEVSSEDDQLVGFGLPSKSTRKEIWDGRGDGYAAFIMEKSCIQGTRMYKLQQYLRKKHQSASATTRTSTKPIGMDDDKELEEAMLSVSPEKLEADSFTVPTAAAAAEVPTPRVPSGAKTAPSAALSIPPSDTTTELQASSADGAALKDEKSKVPVPVPKELSFLLKETTDQTQGPESNPGPSTSVACTSVRKALTFEDSNEDAPSAQPAIPVPVAGYEHELSTWNCSQHQKLWMKTELQDLGLWPGSRPVRNPGNTISLWRLPPQPELIDTVAELPSPNFFQLHPFFLWKPESSIMARLRNNYTLPCLRACALPRVVSAGVGRPRVIVGTSGQYYILSSRLCCRACRRNWFADNPRWLEKLPNRFTNLLPAFLTYKKAICKSVMDELRRTGKPPADMANQVNELMHLKFRRAHLAYLHAIESVWDSVNKLFFTRTSTQCSL